MYNSKWISNFPIQFNSRESTCVHPILFLWHSFIFSLSSTIVLSIFAELNGTQYFSLRSQPWITDPYPSSMVFIMVILDYVAIVFHSDRDRCWWVNRMQALESCGLFWVQCRVSYGVYLGIMQLQNSPTFLYHLGWKYLLVDFHITLKANRLPKWYGRNTAHHFQDIFLFDF